MDTDSKPTITPANDGPLLVKGLTALRNRRGAIECKPTMALCRCGASGNKPFCDGTHAAKGFSSAKAGDRVPDVVDDYAGESVTIHDNRGVCAHAGACTDGLPSVFRLRQEPWIDPHAASAEEIEATVKRCPSGALSISPSAGGDTHGEASVFVAPNGPYVVSGPRLTDAAFGAGAPADHYTLCRCGQSKNKPFCDGSHWSAEFVDDDN